MKKIISGALLCATTSLMAMGAEEAYLYKDPRIMGMGGANVAVGSYSTAVFSNPAGLINIKKDHGFEVELLGLGVEATAQFKEFANDVTTAMDSDDELALLDVLDKYNGEHFHQGLSNYSSISKNSDIFAWSIGLLVAEDANFMTHVQGSTIGLDGVETTSRAYGGVVLGAAKTYTTEIGRVDVGVGMKYIYQRSYEGLISSGELLDENLSQETLLATYENISSGIGVDIGVNYHPVGDEYGHPVVALSVMNIGTIGMDKHYGGQPMTVNLGVSFTPEVKYLNKLVLTGDYIDIFGANKQRVYISQTDYIDYDTYDLIKKIRLGAGLGLVDNQWVSAQLNLGLYQGSYTAGIDFQATVLKLDFATYQEQVGVGSIDIPDRRYMAQLGIGW